MNDLERFAPSQLCFEEERPGCIEEVPAEKLAEGKQCQRNGKERRPCYWLPRSAHGRPQHCERTHSDRQEHERLRMHNEHRKTGEHKGKHTSDVRPPHELGRKQEPERE